VDIWLDDARLGHGESVPLLRAWPRRAS